MSDENPWIAHGTEVSAEHEDLLTGNRAGLKALALAIEQALNNESGEACLAEPDMEYVGVRLLASDPRPVLPKQPIRDIVFALGCGLFVIACVVVFGLGLYTLAGMFK